MLRKSCFSLSLVAAIILLVSPRLQAQTLAQLDLPPQPLAVALRAVGSQTSTNVLFDPPLVEGRQAPALKAELTADQAFTRLLAGSGLKHHFIDERTVMVISAAAAASTTKVAVPISRSSGPRDKPLRLAQAETKAASQDQAGGPEQAGGAGSSEASVDEIVVTGSRIQTGTDTKANSISVISQEEVERTPGVALETLFRRQPEIDNNRGGFSAVSNNNGFSAAATVSLRNLGAKRTLVLIDGKRVMNNVGGVAVDIDTIPLSTIERIEILKGGASSIYGADAIGGVVNIMTKKNFQGLEFSLTGGSAEHDMGSYSVNVTGGGNFDRGNLAITAGYSNRDIAHATNRPWAIDQFFGTDLLGQGPNSSTIPGLVVQNQSAIFATPESPQGGRPYFYGPANQFVVWRTLTGVPGSPPTVVDGLANAGIPKREGIFFLPGSGYRYDFTPELDILITGFQQKNVGLNFHYDMTDNVRFVTGTSYVDKEVPGGAIPFFAGFFATNAVYPGFYIPAFLEDYAWDAEHLINTRTRLTDTNGNFIPNPGNPYGITILGRTRFDGRPRSRINTQTVLRSQAGFEGNFLEDFNWEAGALYTHAQSGFVQNNTPNFGKLAQVTGQRPCGTDAFGGCSIGNFFGVGTLTAAQYDYFLEDTTTDTTQDQTYAYANVTGPIVALPAGELRFAAGVETRKEALETLFDETRKSGAGIGIAQNTRGDYDVDSAFTELSVPLLKDLPLLRALTLTASGRFDDYSNNFGSATTWKAGLVNDVGGGLTLRASYGTGFRAPNIDELFAGFNTDSQDANDPCDVNVGALAGSPKCVVDLGALGTDANEFESASAESVTVNTAGNPNLVPEESKQWTVGFFYQPAALPNFTAQVDFYDVEIEDAINSFSAQAIYNACYGPLELACERITRSPLGDPNAGVLPGTITAVDITPTNAGAENVRGVDFAFNYGTDFGVPTAGRWDGGIAGTYLLTHDVTGPDRLTANNAGHFNFADTGAEPRWRGNIDLGWSMRDVRVGWTTTYFGRVTNLDGTPAVIGNFADEYWLHDLSVNWNPGKYSFVVGVSNVLDEDPPLFLTGFSGANSLPTAGYDYIGRFIFGRAKVTF